MTEPEAIPGATPAAAPSDTPAEAARTSSISSGGLRWRRTTDGKVEIETDVDDDEGGEDSFAPDSETPALPDGRNDPSSPYWTRLKIIATGDLQAAIDSSTGGLGDDDLSGGEAQRVARLRALLDSQWKRMKRRLLGSEEMITRLEALNEACPNFAAVTALVIRAARVSGLTQTPMSLPAMLLVGDAGVGKSHYSRQLAAALGSDVTTIAGTTMADGSSLSGLNPSWRAARPGKVAAALLDARSSSPVILLEELDKVIGLSFDQPLDVLLGLLEPSDACAFQDEFLGVPMRADGIIWICTANSVEPLSAPLRDRLLTIWVPSLSTAQRDAIALRIFAELNAAYDGRFALAADALAPARGLTTRRLKAVLTASLGYAVTASRLTIIDADIAAARALVVSDPAPARMGFDLGRRQS